MNLLAVETSSEACSATVSRDGVLFKAFLPRAGTHSAALFPVIESAMEKAGLSPDGIDLLAVSAGPGSFTGIRIGVAAVKGLAFAGDLPAIGISSLEAAAWSSGNEGPTAALIDARHGNFYFALFDYRDGRYVRKREDALLPAGEIRDLLPPGTGLAGDGAPAFASLFPGNGFTLPRTVQDSDGVARAALCRPLSDAVSARDLEARYLRPSQAEKSLSEKKRAETR
ncbi:MAG: tRNA (adenosine(37)-N6)-threonylcarbamoyltransferase complex dimerization subunit type 1 TsaB [Clostridia bacterium]|nr:tRNA (adenosine(37)-N6)-threonylcarbamoyltransferase complex dimerization subunit type 1 TsaB [Clostridia bacterium]